MCAMRSFAVLLIVLLPLSPRLIAGEVTPSGRGIDPEVVRKLAPLLAKRKGLQGRLEEIDKQVRRLLVTATDIDPRKDRKGFETASRPYLEAAERLPSERPPGPEDAARRTVTLARLRALQTRLAIFFAENGSFAPLGSAPDIADKLQVSRDNRRDGFGSEILIDLESSPESRITLRSPGADRKPHTGDDIVMEFHP